MAKKPEKSAKESQFNFRVSAEELEKFRQASEREGFNNLTAWILWHLRKIVRESQEH